jgi:hypothetical protein
MSPQVRLSTREGPRRIFPMSRLPEYSEPNFRPALRRSRSSALHLMFDPYRMSISLSTAAASRNARRSAPSRVRYSFRRPAS